MYFAIRLVNLGQRDLLGKVLIYLGFKPNDAYLDPNDGAIAIESSLDLAQIGSATQNYILWILLMIRCTKQPDLNISNRSEEQPETP